MLLNAAAGIPLVGNTRDESGTKQTSPIHPTSRFPVFFARERCVSHNYAISPVTIEQILSLFQLSNRYRLTILTERLDFLANLLPRNNVTSCITGTGSAKMCARRTHGQGPQHRCLGAPRPPNCPELDTQLRQNTSQCTFGYKW